MNIGSHWPFVVALTVLSGCPLVPSYDVRCGPVPDPAELGIATGVVGRVNAFPGGCTDAEIHVAPLEGELTTQAVGDALAADDVALVRGEDGPYSVALEPGAWVLCYDDGRDVTCARPVLEAGNVVRVDWTQTDLTAGIATDPDDIETAVFSRSDVFGDAG